MVNHKRTLLMRKIIIYVSNLLLIYSQFPWIWLHVWRHHTDIAHNTRKLKLFVKIANMARNWVSIILGRCTYILCYWMSCCEHNGSILQLRTCKYKLDVVYVITTPNRNTPDEGTGRRMHVTGQSQIRLRQPAVTAGRWSTLTRMGMMFDSLLYKWLNRENRLLWKRIEYAKYVRLPKYWQKQSDDISLIRKFRT